VDGADQQPNVIGRFNRIAKFRRRATARTDYVIGPGASGVGGLRAL
jgi:hypothetical protein